jgi:hypothetical protein
MSFWDTLTNIGGIATGIGTGALGFMTGGPAGAISGALAGTEAFHKLNNKVTGTEPKDSLSSTNFGNQMGNSFLQEPTPYLQTPQQNTPNPQPFQPNVSPTQPDYYTAMMDMERERMEQQRQQREDDARRFSEQRDQDYQRNLQSQLDTLGGRMGGYTINDQSAINAALGQLDMLGNQAANYSSDTSSGINLSGADQYRSQLQGLLDQRRAEQARFDEFGRGVNTSLAGYGDYTVNEDIDAAERALRELMLQAQNYRTDLDVDLRSPQSQIQFALDDINRLGMDRDRQQGIVDAARREAEQNLTNFGRSYTDVDYRNMQALDNLTRQLDDITSPDLNVDLNYDFSDLASQTDPYRDVVQNLRDRRMRDLNTLGEDIGGIGNTLGGFQGEEGQLRDIQSASEVYDVRDRLGGALDSLDRFGTGERSNELRQQIFGQDETYAQLADQLRDRQGQIESDAQAQLDALSEARLSRPDDIRDFEQALRDLSGQRDLFDASVAADELQRLTDQIASRRSDLERDEAARIARQELERRRALQTQGAAGFNNQYISPDDYSAYLRALELGRDDEFYRNMGTGFSRALGLA